MSTVDAPLPAAPQVDGPAPHVLIVRAPYYKDVAAGLTDGAERMLRAASATFDTLEVAGALELAQAIRIVLRGSQRFDGFVAIGCIVRGGTDHYQFVCEQSMGGLMQVALQYGIALGTCVLTVHSIEQALARASLQGHNAGSEAAAACLMQIAAARRFGAA